MRKLTNRRKAFLAKRKVSEEHNTAKRKSGKNKRREAIPEKMPIILPTRVPKSATLIVPESFCLQKNREDVLDLLSNLRSKVIFDGFDKVTIDFIQLKHIAPDAALLLLAEMSRCLAVNPRIDLNGTYPQTEEVCMVLSDLGYFDFFDIPPPKIAASPNFSLRAKSDLITSGQLANSLIEIIEKMVEIEAHPRRSLYNALIECMQNVNHHAYQGKRIKNKIVNRWWMVGYGIPASGEVSFLFYDQGAGIPATLKDKWRHLLSAVRLLTDSDIIVEAIEGHESRLKSVRRGNGLSTLRRLLNAAPEGEFRIHSNSANVCYRRHRESPICDDGRRGIEGTLIVWTLCPDKKSAWYPEELTK